ncbi:MAG: hypothetical protein Tsb002_14690 [Wenzhouxiangellaceae bacterium]
MTTTNNKPPTWFWVVGSLALLWNLMGVFAYVAQVTMSAEDLAAMPEAQRVLYETVPAWATAAFALAVFGGALGCLLLLLRRSWAFAALVISLVAVLVQMYHAFFMSKSFEVFGPGSMIMPLMVIIIAILLVWLARKATRAGWLR